MITLQDEQTAKELLTAFIKEMNDWEKWCNEISEDKTISYDQQLVLQRDRVTKIFLKYCTQKERKNGRPNTISYGMPPSFEYDASDEKIISVTPKAGNKLVLTTARASPMPMNFMYTALKTGGQWLLDSKKRASEWEQKWKTESL